MRRLSIFMVCLLVMGHVIRAETPKRIVQICFLDSDHRPIPYFTALHYNIGFENQKPEMAAVAAFVEASIAEELLPSNPVGSGIDTTEKNVNDTFKDENDLDSMLGVDNLFQDKEYLKSRGKSWETLSLINYSFLDGHTYQLTRLDFEKLGPGRHEVVIPGHLGSGEWEELGKFLVRAAYHWRRGKGSQSTLLKQCDALMARYRERGDGAWVGNLAFVRRLWLEKGPQVVTPEEWRELPYGDKGHFGDPMANPAGFSIQPYRAFKRVLEVNPKDPRAIYWVKVLPWLAGRDGHSPETLAAYIQNAKRVYEAHRDQLSGSQKVHAINILFEVASGSVFELRYWKHLEKVQVDAELGWAIKESESLVKQFPFLQNDLALNWRKHLNYMKEGGRILP